MPQSSPGRTTPRYLRGTALHARWQDPPSHRASQPRPELRSDRIMGITLVSFEGLAPDATRPLERAR